MTSTFVIIIDTFIILFLNEKYRKDYKHGLYFALSILIILPQSIGIYIHDSIPVITTHRVIIFFTIYFWWKLKIGKKQKVPLFKIFIWIIVFNSISLFNAPYLTPAFKRVLSFIIENFLFYIIIVTSWREKDDIQKAINTIYISISILAIITFAEKYSNIRILDVLPVLYNFTPSETVVATLPHPILLGVVLSIGLVLSGYYFSESDNKKLHFINIFAMGGALYFTVSRGPWIAAIIAIILMFLLGNKKLKKTSLIIIIFPLITFIVKPDVYDTVSFYYQITTEKDNAEGASFYYRLELWRKAYDEIRHSMTRLAFGYGLDFHRHADLYGDFSLIEGRRSYFVSWDNEFAVLLLEAGFVGLSMYILLYFGILIKIFLKVFAAEDKERAQLLSIGCCILIIVFMMTNVKMFSQQVMFVFYSFVAIGFNFKLSSNRHL